jgi:hypothetical protein
MISSIDVFVLGSDSILLVDLTFNLSIDKVHVTQSGCQGSYALAANEGIGMDKQN